MKIKTNERKITDMINEIEKRCTVRLLNYEEMVEQLTYIEETVGITKKALDGTIVTVDTNAQNFPNAYRGKPQSTLFIAEYRNRNWYLIKVFRGDCSRYNNKYRLKLSDTAKAAVIARIESLH